jgi:transcriptional regulator GlxA family with amidase domain
MSDNPTMSGAPRKVTAVLFNGFELLDVFGPLEVFGVISDHFQIQLIGPASGSVQSAQGPQAVADCAYHDAPPCDVVLIPGGIGTRELVQDRPFLDWLAGWATPAEYTVSVCTGSAVLAAAGLITGYRATSNKRAFGWVSQQGIDVEWIPEARWVEDRNRWTSSGVAAGIDMTLALVARLHGAAFASTLADRIEHDWHQDPSWDPFARKNGLTNH